MQFVAAAFRSDGSVRDVTEQTLWSVDDAFVGNAAQDLRGLINGLSPDQGKNISST